MQIQIQVSVTKTINTKPSDGQNIRYLPYYKRYYYHKKLQCRKQCLNNSRYQNVWPISTYVLHMLLLCVLHSNFQAKLLVYNKICIITYRNAQLEHST